MQTHVQLDLEPECSGATIPAVMTTPSSYAALLLIFAADCAEIRNGCVLSEAAPHGQLQDNKQP